MNLSKGRREGTYTGHKCETAASRQANREVLTFRILSAVDASRVSCHLCSARVGHKIVHLVLRHPCALSAAAVDTVDYAFCRVESGTWSSDRALGSSAKMAAIQQLLSGLYWLLDRFPEILHAGRSSGSIPVCGPIVIIVFIVIGICPEPETSLCQQLP